MTSTLTTTKRNQSLEVCKLVAAVFVVFLHVPFPEVFGSVIRCLSRMAVPLFFAISGWFSFRVEGARLRKRVVHLWKLEGLGILIYGGYRCFIALYLGGSWQDCWQAVTFPGEKILRWLVLNVDPYSGHLWYLSAAAMCYLVLWAYTKLRRKRPVSYRPLYLLGAVLLCAHFAMGEFARFTGIWVDYRVYRSGAFLGLPMFLMGLFLREHREKLQQKLRFREAWLILGGVALSILEWLSLGGAELYLGTVLAVAAMLLYFDRHPMSHRDMAPLGRMSTTIYLLHLMVLQIYQGFLQSSAQAVLGNAEPWLAPVLVATVSLLIAWVWERLKVFPRMKIKG